MGNQSFVDICFGEFMHCWIGPVAEIACLQSRTEDKKLCVCVYTHTYIQISLLSSRDKIWFDMEKVWPAHSWMWARFGGLSNFTLYFNKKICSVCVCVRLAWHPKCAVVSSEIELCEAAPHWRLSGGLCVTCIKCICQSVPANSTAARAPTLWGWREETQTREGDQKRRPSHEPRHLR